MNHFGMVHFVQKVICSLRIQFDNITIVNTLKHLTLPSCFNTDRERVREGGGGEEREREDGVSFCIPPTIPP